MPRHVAVIMDGNGRWARRRGLPRRGGHREGAESVRVVVRACARLRVEQITLYAFSTENWSRPKREVDYLMRLLGEFLVAERDELMENGIRLVAIGRLDAIPESVRAELDLTRELTRDNDRMILRMALNYGGRQELVDAMRRLAEAIRTGEVNPDDIDESAIGRACYDPSMPPPDLLIRTGGEQRLSNFMLWHMPYTEFYFTPTCWPEFREPQLRKAFDIYASRERRYGGLPGARPSPAKRTGRS